MNKEVLNLTVDRFSIVKQFSATALRVQGEAFVLVSGDMSGIQDFEGATFNLNFHSRD